MEKPNHERKSRGFREKLQQSAKNITSRERKAKSPKTPAQKRATRRKVWGVIGTICLVGVLTITIFVGIFMYYVNKTMKGSIEVPMSEYKPAVSTEMYYDKNAGTGENEDWYMYQTLYYEQNRIWVDLGQIPDYLQQAAIAIEDKRFESHHGVDWYGTMRAIVRTLTGGSMQGGSTITQQTIKNITGDNQDNVKRKIMEIYRALALEKEYSKDDILEVYLNTIYLGEMCYGVQTASQAYFGKDAADLTLAESACLIGITNNPSMYDPLLSDWTRENNRDRQLTILKAMLDQNKISSKEYEAAKNEEVVFTNGYTCLGNYVEDHPEALSPEEQEKVSTANNSFYTDQVIEDVADAFVELYNLQDDPADQENGRSAHSKAVSMIYSGGYKIYTAQNITLQQKVEAIYEDSSNLPYTRTTNGETEQLQSGVTIVDPKTGCVAAMVGGIGPKKVDRGWNWATATRQCGSAIKPIAVYAPALDDGTITAASALDDYPAMLLNGSPYPKNSHAGFYGLTSVQTALTESLNTCAVDVAMQYGVNKSYRFMTDKLGFSTLTQTDGSQVGAMALGGLEQGVTTEEMAAAYAAFANEGVYTEPRTFVRVEDSDGKVVLENSAKSHVAMKESTAYIMNGLLEQVIQSGTGSGAYFSGMTIAGKTGSTDDWRDRYFVGYSPYYSCAVWTGYKSNANIDTSRGNPAAKLWKLVMQSVHEGLENKDFASASGLTTVTVCADSGLLATDACTHDVRGSRARTVTVAADTAPTAFCGRHTMVSYCTEGKHIATSGCPASSVIDVALVDYSREAYGIAADDDAYLLKNASEGECPVHGGGAVDPSGGDDDDDDGKTPSNPFEGIWGRFKRD